MSEQVAPSGETSEETAAGSPQRSPAQVASQERATEAAKRARAEAKVYVAPPEDGADEMLRDMRHVYMNEKRWDKTPGQKGQRRFFEKDPKGFNDQKRRYEDELLASKGVSPSEAGEEVLEDVGAAKVLELIEKLLGVGREPAKKNRPRRKGEGDGA